MSEPKFDPYHKWLGIPPEEQPPDIYRLLAISRFESDPDVIEAAADQRMAHLRTYQTSKHSALTQKLLGEVAAAKILLLNPQKRAAYDSKLKPSATTAPPVAAKPLPKARPLPKVAPHQREAGRPSVEINVETHPVAAAGSGRPATARNRQPGAQLWLVIGGAAAVCVVVVVGLLFALRDSSPTVAERRTGDAASGRPAAPTVPPSQVRDKSPNVLPAAETKSPTPESSVARPPENIPNTATPTVLNPPIENLEPPPPPPNNPEKPATPTPPSEVTPSPSPPPATVATPEPAVEPVTPEPVNPKPAIVPPRKLAVPTDAELDEAIKKIQELLKSKFASARTPQEKSDLAKELCRMGAETLDDPPSRFALLDESRRIATDIGDYETAFSAIDNIAETFDSNPLAAKADVLAKLSRDLRTIEQQRRMCELASGLFDAATEALDYDIARNLSTIALNAAKKAHDPAMLEEASNRGKQIRSLKQVFDDVKAALIVLKSDANDAAANLTVGRYRCLIQGDWETGLPMLAKSDDPALEELARRDLANPTQVDEQVALGDVWLDVSRKEKEFEQRAAYWYSVALPGLTGLARAAVEKKMSQISPETAGLGSLAATAILLLTFEKNTATEQGGKKVFADGSPRKLVGEIRGEPKSVFGVAGDAIYFPGSSDGVVIRGDFPTRDAPRTLSAWLKFEDSDDDYTYFVRTGNSREGARGVMFSFFAYKNQNKWKVELYNLAVETSVPVDNRWHHHCAVYDGKVVSYLIDMQLAGQKSYTLDTLPGPVEIGGRPGSVDEVAFFDRALSPQEVKRIYEHGRAGRRLFR